MRIMNKVGLNIVLLALFLVQAAEAATNQKLCSQPMVIKQTFSAVGYGSSKDQFGRLTSSSQKAMRAARINAYRALSKQLYDYRFDGTNSIASMIKQHPALRGKIKAMVQGAKQVGANRVKDGLYEVQMELVADRSFQLRTECPKPISTTPWQQSLIMEGEGKYREARAALQPLLNQPLPKADRELLFLRMGWLYHLTLEYNKSIRHYQSALKTNPGSMDARLGILLPQLAQQRWYEVERYANRVLKDSPWNYLAHVRLMIAEEGMQKWRRLEAHARKLSERYPGDVTVLVYLARAQIWQGKQKEAKMAYQQVLHRSPLHVEANNFIRVN